MIALPTDWRPRICFPTKAPAGSDWKIAVLRLRVERGEPIHHPNDNRAVTNQPSFLSEVGRKRRDMQKRSAAYRSRLEQ